MRLRLLFSFWTAIALLSLAACEFHADAGSPPATPSSTPASTAPLTNPTASAPAPASTLPTNSMHTGHIVLKHDDAGA